TVNSGLWDLSRDVPGAHVSQETLLEARCASGGSRRRNSDFCARPGRLRAIAERSRYAIGESHTAVVKRSVALDEATIAHRAQPQAQRLCCLASIRRDADAMQDRRFAHGRAHEERLTAAEDRLIFLLELRVSGKRAALQTIADELHRPCGSWRRRRARGGRHGFCRELRRPNAWRVAGNADLPGPRVRSLPLLGGVTGNAANVSERLRWQRAFSTEPVLHALRAGVVGGGREPKIAEFGAQLAQKLGRFRQRLSRIERIEQKTLGGRRRH